MTLSLQIGKETTAGTAVAATNILYGEGRLVDDRQARRQQRRPGRYAPNLIDSLIGRMGSISHSADATFEQLPYFFQAGVKDATPAADGSGSSGFAYTYDMPLGTNSSPAVYTIEDDSEVKTLRAPYAYVEQIVIEGSADNVVTVSTTWKTAIVSELGAGKTGGLTLQTVEDIEFNCGALYIDDSGGTIGTTAVADKLMRFKLTINTGLKPRLTQDCALGFARLLRDPEAVSAVCEFTIDGAGSTASDEHDDYEAENIRLIRVEFTGADYGTAGTGTAFSGKKGVRFDMAGKYSKFEVDEEDGGGIGRATFDLGESTADSLFLTTLITNELSALV